MGYLLCLLGWHEWRYGNHNYDMDFGYDIACDHLARNCGDDCRECLYCGRVEILFPEGWVVDWVYEIITSND